MPDPWTAQREALGAFIRSQRQLANLSLRQLAELTSVSNPYLSQVERGHHQPSVRVLKLIADALDLSTETLLSYAGLATADDSDESAPSVEAAIRADDRRAQRAQTPVATSTSPCSTSRSSLAMSQSCSSMTCDPTGVPLTVILAVPSTVPRFSNIPSAASGVQSAGSVVVAVQVPTPDSPCNDVMSRQSSRLYCWNCESPRPLGTDTVLLPAGVAVCAVSDHVLHGSISDGRLDG